MRWLLKLARRVCGLCYCRSTCWGWFFLEHSGEVSRESLCPSVLFWFQIAQIVEAGPHTLDEQNCIQPGRYLRLRLSPTELFTPHVAKPSPALGGRSVIVTSGRALGGGSSVNCMKTVFGLMLKLNYDVWSVELSSFLRKGRRLGLRRLGKCIWK